MQAGSHCVGRCSHARSPGHKHANHPQTQHLHGTAHDAARGWSSAAGFRQPSCRCCVPVSTHHRAAVSLWTNDTRSACLPTSVFKVPTSALYTTENYDQNAISFPNGRNLRSNTSLGQSHQRTPCEEAALNPISVRRKRQRLPSSLLIENASARMHGFATTLSAEAFPMKASDDPGLDPVRDPHPDARYRRARLARLCGHRVLRRL